MYIFISFRVTSQSTLNRSSNALFTLTYNDNLIQSNDTNHQLLHDLIYSYILILNTIKLLIMSTTF